MDKSVDVFEDISFAITADTGKFGYQATLLIHSIRDHYPDSEIFTFIPESSYSDLSSDLRATFEEFSTVVVDKIPVPEYPLTSLNRAFIEAATQSDSKYIASLDTDTVLLSKIEKPATTSNADLFLKPVDFGERYWGSSHSKKDWQQVYSHFEKSLPEMPSNLSGDVDNSQLIVPYYQGAVVITSNKELPARWLEMVKEVVTFDIYISDENWFHDQITLSVLSQEHTVGLLSQRQNYPLYSCLTCPADAQVIHYQNGAHLYRHRNCPSIKKARLDPGFSEVMIKPTVTDYYHLFQNNLAQVIPYPHHKKINFPIRFTRSCASYIRNWV